MAFTSRATRFKKHQKHSEKLGPGAYNVAVSKSTTCSSASFSSTSRGLLHYEIDEYQAQPGQYYQEEHVHKALSAHSNFKSNSQRFMQHNHPKTPIPGPADYNVQNNTIEQQMQAKKRNSKRLESAERMADITKNPPSIPYGDTSYGYETTIDGRLIPRTPPILNPSSPGHTQKIHTEKDEDGACASKWSKSKSKRFGDDANKSDDNAKNAINYTLDRFMQHKNDTDTKMQKRRKIQKRTMSLATLQKLQRFYAERMASDSLQTHKNNKPHPTEQQQVSHAFISKSKRFDVKQDEIPGPAHYYNATTPVDTTKKPQQSKIILHTTVSRTQTPAHMKHNYKNYKEIFAETGIEEYDAELGPGPGAYDIQSTFKSIEDINAANIQLGLPPKAPFLSTVCKFNEDSVATNKITPGPGYYNGSILNVPLLNKPRIKYHKAPFGQHGNRKCNESTTTNQNAIIGPGQYDISMASYLMAPNKSKCGATAVFKSGTERMSDDKRKNVPGPGTYDLIRGVGAGEKEQDVPHNVYRFATKKDLPFISATERFGSSKCEIRTPGVGTYTISDGETKRVSRNEKFVPFGTTNDRFTIGGVENNTPGPNVYEVVKRDSFVKKTYNCTYD